MDFITINIIIKYLCYQHLCAIIISLLSFNYSSIGSRIWKYFSMVFFKTAFQALVVLKLFPGEIARLCSLLTSPVLYYYFPLLRVHLHLYYIFGQADSSSKCGWKRLYPCLSPSISVLHSLKSQVGKVKPCKVVEHGEKIRKTKRRCRRILIL